MILRSEIINEAMDWVGTPYQHQTSLKGGGCDCLGFIRGIWRAFYGEEPVSVPPYTPDWAERSHEETLKTVCDQVLVPVDMANAQPGDVLLFRMKPEAPAKHMALLIKPDMIAHAYWGRAVTQSFLAPFWKKRRAYAYKFPDVKDDL